jgi:TolB-like protein/Tfp pilus assembly protein PilF
MLGGCRPEEGAIVLMEELKRRKVLKIGGAYLVLAWLAVQVASIVFPTFDAPVWVLRVFILVLALGFPITVVMAWLFDSTPEGLRLDPAAQGNKRIMGAAAAVAALAVAWYFVGQPALRDAPPARAAAAAAPASPAAPKGPPTRSIAVLPFVDMSQGKDQEYFSDGITEEILNELTHIEGLKVAGRTSSFHFKGRNDSLQAIGAALGVAHVLEGSVRKQGDRIRITAQLIKVDDGFHLWSQDYDRKLDDIFAVQDEISAAIASALKAKLPGGDDAPARIDPAVYDDYLRARQLVADRSGSNLRKAIALFEKVSAREPEFDAAWSGRCKALSLVNNYEGGAVGDLPAQARSACARALELNPGNAEAKIMMAFVDAVYLWRWDDARQGVREATELAPNDAEVANFAGDVYRFFGDPESFRWERHAVELDPLADFNHSDLGWVQLMHGMAGEALANGERAKRIDPTYWTAYDLMGRAYLALGDMPHALAEADALARVHPGSFNELDSRASIALAQGDRATARKHLATLRARADTEGNWFVVAGLQARLGDTAEATKSLRRGLEVHDPYFPSDVELWLPSQWPADPALQAVFASPEVAPLYAERVRHAAK